MIKPLVFDPKANKYKWPINPIQPWSQKLRTLLISFPIIKIDFCHSNSGQPVREWVRVGRAPLSSSPSRGSNQCCRRQWFWGTGLASSPWSPWSPRWTYPPYPSTPLRMSHSWRTEWRRSWRGRRGLQNS